MINLQSHNKILTIQTAFLGDVILITPLIRATKQIFPDSTIDVLIRPEYKEVFHYNPYINNIITFDKKDDKSKSFFNVLKKIKSGEYNLAISPHSSFTSALLMFLSKIPNRLGFNRYLSSILLTEKVPHLHNIHKIEKNLHLLSVFTDKDFDIQTEIFLTEKEYIFATNIFEKNMIDGKNVIAISPGSIWQTKCWLEEYYVKLSRMLWENGFGIIFIGGKEENELCERIIEKSDIKAVNLAGKSSILESAAVLKRCELLICNDSGPLHIANAVKTDVFAFFGPTVKEFGYYPFRENDFVFEVNLPCRPCGSHGGKKCPEGHHKCMKEIPPEIVIRKVEEKFGL